MSNDSGIKSLAGFSYQIRVFVLKCTALNENEELEFETIDDIALKKMDNLDNVNTLVAQNDEFIAVQVKKTTISKSTAKNILFNWLLIDDNKQVKKYILVTAREYNNKDRISTISLDELYNEIIKSKVTNSSSLIKQVKDKYKDNKDKFLLDCNNIKNNYSLETIENIDEEIYENYKNYFRKAGNAKNTYERRIERLLQIITCEILEKINSGNPYTLDYAYFMRLIENISQEITDEHFTPDYVLFKKNDFEFNKLEISNSREYHQLTKCKFSKELIIEHLCREEYYKNYKYRMFESGKSTLLSNIEEISHYNFLMVRTKLQNDNNDTPLERFICFSEKNNSYAESDELKTGSGVYLTREEETERQISWEDESNEQK